MKTSFDDSGYGMNVDASVKAEFFMKDLAELEKDYGVRIVTHPFYQADLYIVPIGESFAGDHARIKTVDAQYPANVKIRD
jgi:hypothetical protein